MLLHINNLIFLHKCNYSDFNYRLNNVSENNNTKQRSEENLITHTYTHILTLGKQKNKYFSLMQKKRHAAGPSLQGGDQQVSSRQKIIFPND